MSARRSGFDLSFGFNPHKAGVIGLFKGLLFIFAVVVVVAGFAFLDGYVQKQTITPSTQPRTIEMAGPTPAWVSDEIKNRVYAAASTATAGQNQDEALAKSIQQNVRRLVPWLDDVRVQTTYTKILISGRWRKPLAVVTAGPPRPTSGHVEAGKAKYYLDTDLVVLDYIPITNLPIVTVDGLEFDKPPALGQVWRGDDLAAALVVLSRLEKMDSAVTPNKPLLREIDKIDVSNFDGRKNKREPHITLLTKEGTEIIWGAEIGAWQRHLESPDDDKLAKLYTYYQQAGTLSGVKYINLRDPRQKIPLPIDTY
jgi:cell division septal protein FtsQ